MRAGAATRRDASPAPLVWTFDGPFGDCLADIEDTLRRAIVQVGDVARIAVLIELSLPALQRRVDAGDAHAAGLGPLLERVGAAYGLPAPPRVRHLRSARPARHAGRRLSELITPLASGSLSCP